MGNLQAKPTVSDPAQRMQHYCCFTVRLQFQAIRIIPFISARKNLIRGMSFPVMPGAAYTRELRGPAGKELTAGLYPERPAAAIQLVFQAFQD